MAKWLTTAQVLQHTDLAVTQQAVKKAAKREYARCGAAGTVPTYVRKNAAGHWEVRDDWEMFRSWKRRGEDRVAQVNARHEQAEELARLRELCAQQAERIAQLEAELARAREVVASPDASAEVANEDAPAEVPDDVLHDDAALLAYWNELGCPSRRVFAEAVGMSKSWVSAHLRKAGA